MLEFIKSEYQNQILEGIEKNFLISKTNPKGIITYVNDLFCKISGYTKEELLGKPHNIVRHPDMPKAVFKELWETIKDKKQPWTGIVKNRTKQGGHYWVTVNIFPIFSSENPEEIVEYISIRKEITEQMDGYEKDQLFSSLYEILNLYYRTNDLKQTLEFSLEKILKFSWLEVESKAGIMLWKEEKKALELFVYKGVGQSLVEMCSLVPLGRCLCGRTAQKRSILFKDCVDEEHDNRPAGMTPHGHYNIPLMYKGKLLGVLFLYLEEHHKKRPIEEEFLNILGQTLGSIIYKDQLEKDLQNVLSKNQLIINFIKTYSSRNTFSYVREKILKEKDFLYKIESEQIISQKYLYLMFLDIVGFTKLSENLPTHKMVELLNQLFTPIVNIIYRYQGDIDKFIGDAIFSFYDNPVYCLNAGLEILKIVQDPIYNPYKIQVRIGIHAGTVVQANLGNNLRRDFTLIGDAVNTTQRIERAAFPNSILTSKEFLKNIKNFNKNSYKISKQMLLKAKNKSEIIPVFAISLINQPLPNLLHNER